MAMKKKPMARAGAGKTAARKTTATKSKSTTRKMTPPDPQAEMAAWQKAMTPSDGHRRLEPMVGTFTTRTTWVMAPGAPEQVSTGVSEHRWVLGGRQLEQSYKATMMEMPYEGLGYTGYDNVQKKYVGVWMDTFGTGIMNSESVGKPSDGKISFVSRCHMPGGKQAEFEQTVRIVDHDHHTFEMWTKAPNGKRFRTMLVEYTRK